MCRARVYVHSASIALSKSKLVGGVVPSASRSFWWAGLISRLQRLYFATFGDASHPQPSADSRKHKCLQLVSGQPRRRQCWEAPNLLPACSRHSWLRFDDSLDFLSASKDESFVKATGFLPWLPGAAYARAYYGSGGRRCNLASGASASPLDAPAGPVVLIKCSSKSVRRMYHPRTQSLSGGSHFTVCTLEPPPQDLGIQHWLAI